MSRQEWMGVTVRVHYKGGNSQAEMNQANQVSQQQLALQQQQFALQQQQFGMVNPSLQSIIANGGMLPAQQSAMTSAALNQIGTGEQQAIGSINQNLVARGVTGGSNAGGGAIAQNFGALQQGLLGQEASSLQNIQLAKGQGLQQALGTALGEGGQYGQQAVSLGGQGVNALGIGQQAANAADQASTGFWGSLVGGLAGLGSAGIGKIPCWVATELYGGWYSDEAMAIRRWLACKWYMVPFVWFYVLTAKHWAIAIRRSRVLRRVTKRLFDGFLRYANG